VIAESRPRVKICCIAGIAEARLAIRCGASAVGLVSRMPSGPGPIPEARIARIAAAIRDSVMTVLLTSETDPREIVLQQKRAGVSAVQIVDRVGRSCRRAVREALPGITLIQVVHVLGPEAVDEALDAAEDVDAILLDSGNPGLAVKQLGGTGRVHDWSVSAKVRELLPVPLFLAGGLNPGNVARAVEEVGPAFLDVCSGVRTGGKLDGVKLRAFFAGAGYAGQTSADSPEKPVAR
jgi:phosphoribosylanthranilate isomerase